MSESKKTQKSQPLKTNVKSVKKNTSSVNNDIKTKSSLPNATLGDEKDELKLQPNVSPIRRFKKTMVWMDVVAGPHQLGRMVIELYNDCPLAFENFRSLCTGDVKNPTSDKPMTYKNKQFHVLRPDYVMGGDMKNGNANTSIYGGPFVDESAGLARNHDDIGTVSLFSTSANQNDSKFLITLKPRLKHLDGQFVVIGKVIKGLRAAFSLALYGDQDGNPETICRIADVGRYKKGKSEVYNDDNNDSENEDDDDDDDEDEDQIDILTNTQTEKNLDTSKPNCPKCEGKTKYIKRVLGKGARFFCVNKECKEGFWYKDDKIDEDVAQEIIAERKSKNIELATQKQLVRKEKYEARKQRNLSKQLSKTDNKQKKPNNDETTNTHKETVTSSKNKVNSEIIARNVAGKHLIDMVLNEFAIIEKMRLNKEVNRERNKTTQKKFRQMMDESRDALNLPKRSREEIEAEDEERQKNKKARFEMKAPRRDKNREKNPVILDKFNIGNVNKLNKMNKPKKDKTRYRNREAPPEEWKKRQESLNKPQ